MLVIMSVTRRGDEVNMVHVYIILEHVAVKEKYIIYVDKMVF